MHCLVKYFGSVIGHITGTGPLDTWPAGMPCIFVWPSLFAVPNRKYSSFYSRFCTASSSQFMMVCDQISLRIEFSITKYSRRGRSPNIEEQFSSLRANFGLPSPGIRPYPLSSFSYEFLMPQTCIRASWCPAQNISFFIINHHLLASSASSASSFICSILF